MYNAVICCINSKYIHSSLAPWCLLSGVRESGFHDISAAVVEGTINENVLAVAERIEKMKPNAVGFCCYIWNINYVLETARILKERLPELTVFLGGPEVSFNPKQTLEKNAFVDYIISGEGETALPKLLHALADNEIPPKGLATMRIGNEISTGVYHKVKNTVSPYCKEYFDSLNGRIAYIEASRGCPYNCAFCLSGAEKNVSYFELERVKSEMLQLANSGTKTVKFVDRTFNAGKKRAAQILTFIKENYGKAIPSDVCFHFEIAADILDVGLLELISSMPSGSVQFEAGIQSFNEKTLEAVNRKTNLEKLCKNVKELVSYKNCHVHIDLIAGLPFENMASFKESFNRAFELGANMLQLGFLKILHGSCMETDKEKYPCEYSKKPPYEVISTPWLSESELKQLHIFEDAFERLCNSGRFERTVEYIMKTQTKTPFDVIDGFSRFVDERLESGASLEQFTESVFDYFSALDGIDSVILRDKMITDRLASNSSGIIPKCLQIHDERLRKAKHELAVRYPQKRGIKRSAAILYESGDVIFCDYDKKDRASGEYTVRYLPGGLEALT